jgi:hypothetical protein
MTKDLYFPLKNFWSMRYEFLKIINKQSKGILQNLTKEYEIPSA